MKLEPSQPAGALKCVFGQEISKYSHGPTQFLTFCTWAIDLRVGNRGELEKKEGRMRRRGKGKDEVWLAWP